MEYWVEYRIKGNEGPQNRCEHTSTTIEKENRIVVFGGTNGVQFFQDVWRLTVKPKRCKAKWAIMETTGHGPEGLAGHTTTLCGRNLYVFGGRNEKGSYNHLWVLDYDLKHWEKIPTFGIAPCARFGHSAVLLPGTRSIAIFGGTAGDRRFSFQDFYIYDTMSKEWSMIFNLTGEFPLSRYQHCCMVETELASTETLNLPTLPVTNLQTSSSSSTRPLHLTTPRPATGIQRVNSSSRSSIHIASSPRAFSNAEITRSPKATIGNRSNRADTHRSPSVSHEEEETCFDLQEESKKTKAGVVRLYIFGGRDLEQTFEDFHSLSFDTTSQMIESCKEICAKGSPEGRYGHSSFSLGNRVFIWGGRTNESLSHEFFSYEEDNWYYHHEYEFDAPPGRYGHTLNRIQRHVLILGGNSNMEEDKISETPDGRISVFVLDIAQIIESMGFSEVPEIPASSIPKHLGTPRAGTRRESVSRVGSIYSMTSSSSSGSLATLPSTSSYSVNLSPPSPTASQTGTPLTSSSSSLSSSVNPSGVSSNSTSSLNSSIDEVNINRLKELSGALSSPENLKIIVECLFNKRVGVIRIRVEDTVAFSGYDILHWLVEHLRIDRTQALIIGKALTSEGFIESHHPSNTTANSPIHGRSNFHRTTFSDSSDLYQPSLFARELFGIDLTIDVKTEISRTQVVTEIINTERKYVNDLKILIDVYMKPLQSSFKDTITAAQFSNIFSNVVQIHKLNSDILSNLIVFESLSSEEQFVGRVFVEMSDLLRSYTSYCVKQAIADREIKVIKKNPVVSKFLEERRAQPECGKLDLESFIIKPLQRICRYPLLLKELLKNTYETHPDYKNTQVSISKLEEVVRDINEKKRASENQMAIIELQQLFYDDVQLVKPARKLLLDAEMRRVTTTGGLSKRHVFLFNDLLVISEEKLGLTNQKYRLKDLIPIRNCIVWDDDGSKERSKRTFVIVRNDKKEKIKLVTDTIEIKQQWVNEINNCIIGPLNLWDKEAQVRKKALEAFKAMHEGQKSESGSM